MSRDEDKRVDENDTKYIAKVAGGSKSVLFSNWIKISEGNKKDFKSKIFVVTRHSLMVVKGGLMGRSVRKFPLISTQHIAVLQDGMLQVDYREQTQLPSLFIQASERTISLLIPLIKQCIFGVWFGFPLKKRPSFDIPERYLRDFKAPYKTDEAGFPLANPETYKQSSVLLYEVLCEMNGMKALSSVKAYLQQSFENRRTALDIGTCLEVPINNSKAAENALRHLEVVMTVARGHRWFTQINSEKIRFGDEGPEKLSILLHQDSVVKQVLALGMGITHKGIEALVKRFPDTLEDLALSNNPGIGEAGVSKIVESLRKTNFVIQNLALDKCGITVKAMSCLVDLLKLPKWCDMFTGIKGLDVSNNRFGKQGTQYLTQFLESAKNLESFKAASCDLDTKLVIQALDNNPILLHHSLKRIDLSGNTWSNEANDILCNNLKLCGTLSLLYLANMNLSKQQLADLLVACAPNSQDIQFSFDFRGNNFGKDVAKVISNSLDKIPGRKVTKIRFLNFDQTALGADGIISLCQVLPAFSQLKSLGLSRNVKGGSAKPLVAKAIMSFIEATPSLQSLSIQGGDSGTYYITTSSLKPLLESLQRNKTLSKLNISHNQLGDSGARLIADLLKSKTNMCRQINLDHNKLGVKAVHILCEAVLNNDIITHIIPFTDLRKISGIPKKERDELQEMVLKMHKKLIKNRESSPEEQPGAEDEGDEYEEEGDVDEMGSGLPAQDLSPGMEQSESKIVPSEGIPSEVQPSEAPRSKPLVQPAQNDPLAAFMRNSLRKGLNLADYRQQWGQGIDKDVAPPSEDDNEIQNVEIDNIKSTQEKAEEDLYKDMWNYF